MCEPFLEVVAIQNGSDIRIESIVRTEPHNQQLRSLLALATENLIDSIRHEIGAFVVSAPNSKGYHPLQNNDCNKIATGIISPQIEKPLNNLIDSTVESFSTQEENNVSKPPQQSNKERTVFQWQAPLYGDLDAAPVVAAVQAWSRRFTNKGAGLEATHLADGVQLTLGVSDTEEAVLRLQVIHSSDRSMAVISKLILSDWTIHDATRVSAQTEGLSAETSTASLAQIAAANLETSLAKELNVLIVQPTNQSTTSNSSFAENTTEVSVDPAFIQQGAASSQEYFEIPVDDSAAVSDAFRVVGQATSAAQTQTSSSGGAGDLTNHNQGSNVPFVGARGQRDSSDERFVSQRDVPFKRRDPTTVQKAATMGLRLEKFEGTGLEEQAMKELNDMLRNSRSDGFLSVIKSYEKNASAATSAAAAPNTFAVEKDLSGGGIDSFSGPDSSSATSPLEDLFQKGKQHSALSLQEILNRPTLGESAEELRQPTPHLPLLMENSPLKNGGIDIFQSPAELYADPSGQGAHSELQRTAIPASSLLAGQNRAENTHFSPPDPASYELDQHRLSVLLIELNRTAVEMQDRVVDSYRDLLLSENILYLLRDANASTFEWDTRQLLKKITEKSIELTTELAALIKTESVRHLQTIEDVCEIAADFQQDDLKFLERMHYIKPRFDTSLLAFLSYAIGEEMARITLRGVDPTLAPSDWLKVLHVVKQGVLAEFESRYAQLLEPLLLVVRFDDPALRSAIFERFVNITPAMELAYLKALAQNMISNVLERSCAEEASQQDQQMSRLLPQKVFSTARIAEPLPDSEVLVRRIMALQGDVDKFLSDEIIAQRVAAFRAQAAEQGQSVVVRHRNPVMQAEMETARELERDAARTGGVRQVGEMGLLLGDGHL